MYGHFADVHAKALSRECYPNSEYQGKTCRYRLEYDFPRAQRGSHKPQSYQEYNPSKLILLAYFRF